MNKIKIIKSFLITFAFVVNIFLNANEPSPSKLQILYSSLDPLSISHHLAFWELYPQTFFGKKALNDARYLLTKHHKNIPSLNFFHLPPCCVQQLVQVVTSGSTNLSESLDASFLNTVDLLGNEFPNRQLMGWNINSEHFLIELPENQIDLSKALFISSEVQEGDEIKTKYYLALLDLMALQIAAKLSPLALAPEKIRAINDFIFHEQGFRFPPQSLFIKDVDLYSFLPSVLDKKRGICLGISILYLCLAQRLGLPLEIITPPGHIYIRYRHSDNTFTNIETTARGMHIDCEKYLGIENYALEKRTIKEVIGMVQMNAAAHHWRLGDHAKALSCYLKAKPYLPSDPLLMELTGYQYLFLGFKDEGIALLEQVAYLKPTQAISISPLAQDYLQGEINEEIINIIFSHDENKKEKILEKRQKLLNALEKFKQSRTLFFGLANCALQLHRYKEALGYLKKYHELDQSEILVEYLLAGINIERKNYPEAWKHLEIVESLEQQYNRISKPFLELRRNLLSLSPK